MVLATYRAEEILSQRAAEVRKIAAALVKKHRLDRDDLTHLLGPPGRG
jgi:hypothetical protein